MAKRLTSVPDGSIEDLFIWAKRPILVLLNPNMLRREITVNWHQPQKDPHEKRLFYLVGMRSDWTTRVVTDEIYRSGLKCVLRINCPTRRKKFKNPLIQDAVFTEGSGYLWYDGDIPVVYADIDRQHEIAKGFLYP